MKSQVESRVSTEAGESLDQQTQEAVDQIRKQTYDRFASEFDKFRYQNDTGGNEDDHRPAGSRECEWLAISSSVAYAASASAVGQPGCAQQIHETALTNLALTLGLDGKRLLYRLPSYAATCSARSFRSLPQRTRPRLARKPFSNLRPEDAVQVHINNGKAGTSTILVYQHRAASTT